MYGEKTKVITMDVDQYKVILYAYDKTFNTKLQKKKVKMVEIIL